MSNFLNYIFSKYGKFSNDVKLLIVLQFLSSIMNGVIGFLLIFYIRFIRYSPIIYGLMTSLSGAIFLISILPSGIISS